MSSELINKCMSYMEEKGLSQVKLAGKIGIAESTFSRYLKGNYPNPETITEKVKAFFEKEEKRETSSSASEIGFAMTSMSSRVMNVLEYSRVQKIIGVVYGDAGIGKTFTCRHWMKDKPDVVMVTINPAFANPKAFLKVLARALKTNSSGNADEVLLDIYMHLGNGDKTIIIDEAQHLTRRTLEIIRSINDATETAIILVGNDTVYSKLTGKQQAEFAQLFSRIGIRSSNLLTDMFKAEDIKEVFQDVQESEAVEYLLRICRSKYGLRGAVYTYNNALNNGDTTANGLRAMATVMGITA